ncbi:hypothetical protein [Streptomyces sp. NRRL B-3229]|uniref:hypothetical protein n=1 Tax=Streptomyces sp. NRRL B-3229 TaxID=1463836 RepID=UPI00068E5DC9|nr:hypothetical protein [Streptomyces sp. NRRL B-3229]
MSTFNFHNGADIKGVSNFGDGGRIVLTPEALAAACDKADELVGALGDQAGPAEELREELEGAEEDRAVDASRIHRLLATIQDSTAAGTGVVALIDSLRRLIGR